MFTGADIRKIFMIVPAEKEQELLASLGEKGIIHFDGYHNEDQEKRQQDTGSELALVEDIYSLMQKMPGIHDTSYNAVPDGEHGKAALITMEQMQEDRANLEKIQEKVRQYERISDRIQAEQRRMADRLKILFRKSGILRSLPSLDNSSLSCMVLEENIFPGPGNWHPPVPAILVQARQGTLVITLEQFREEVEGYLEKTGIDKVAPFKIEDVLQVEAERDACYSRYRQLAWRQVRLGCYMNDMKKEWDGIIRELQQRYRVKRMVVNTSAAFDHTGATTIMTGWLDYSESDSAVQLLRNICGNQYIFIISSRKETLGGRKDVPVRLRNNRFFAPFELLLKNAGTPSLKEIDPTPLAAIAFIIMFGVMFGDIGQGLVLVLAGMLLHLAGRKKRSAFMKNGGMILAYCGASAVMFGVLYGSVFSNEHLIAPLWFSPMQNIMRLLGFTVMMGACFIVIGLVTGVINRLRRGDVMEAILGTRGLAGLFFYLGLCSIAAWYVQYQSFPSEWVLAVLLGLPIVIFFFRGIIWKFIEPGEQAFPHGIFEYVVESIVEIIEMVSGYLGNTISFIRTGAFALSHAGLGMAIYALADLLGEGGSGAASVAVIVTGNIFIILLEGLLCSIQALRLEYYEFFSRFYEGNGRPFVPFSFKQPAA